MMLGMPSCKKVSQLVSQSMEQKLPLRKQICLRIHLMMCKLCAGFSQELRQIQQAARQHGKEIENDASFADAMLSLEARERIRRALENQQSDPHDSPT